MTSPLRDIFGHNAWANRRLIAFLGTLPAETLAVSSDAVFGSVLATMHHVVNAEAAYLAFFSGRMPSWYQPESEPATLDQLAAWERDVAAAWAALPLAEIEARQPLERTRRDGSVTRMLAGHVLAQAIHHGNVHREQVSHVLTSLGVEVPDLSLYAYAREAGA